MIETHNGTEPAMGSSCPQCGSEKIDFGMPDIGLPRDGMNTQPDWACMDCGYGWSDPEG